MASVRELRDEHAVVSDAHGVWDGALAWASILAVIAVAHTLAHPLVYLVAAAVIGGLQHALVNLAHEAWHRLCLRSAGANDGLGAWLYAYPVGIPFHHDRERHLRHHRLVGLESDPDWPNYTNAGRRPAFRLRRYLLGRLLGSQLFATFRSVVLDRAPRIALATDTEDGAATREGARGEFVRIALVQLVLFGAFAFFGRWWEYLVLWLGPVATFAAFYVGVRAFVEHASERDDVAPRTRLHDFAPGRVERFFLSPCHFHFHALHHAHPNVPHFRLEAFRRALDEAGHVYPGTREGGYVLALRAHLRRAGSPDAASLGGSKASR